jgi:hypothetical protein
MIPALNTIDLLVESSTEKYSMHTKVDMKMGIPNRGSVVISVIIKPHFFNIGKN